MTDTKMSNKVLIIEDDKEIARLVELRLRSEGFEVTWADRGVDGLSKFDTMDPDVVILDLMLDDIDGYEICRRVRKKSNVPIIMLTAKSTELDQVLGIATGADHYITKPFSLNVLVAKVRGLLRRSQQFSAVAKPKDQINFADMIIDAKAHSVTRNGKRIHLTVKEFELLWLLMSNPGKVFTREELFTKVWKKKTLVDCRTVDVHVNKLRKKIEDRPFSASIIRTIHKVGYCFDPSM
ncbi:MAG TPA: response regulator transcription factor [Caldisericia bacterium]|nr:response regulator transcription factor [Caldisericia bacterium]HPF48089.1 response regulator transcription factor [Caldisericia bacterium]HPI83974.1 response regulator transcription factor [Caldisericia bacterium]HPQ92542.1 response regulator transcription factor [Caldisericia bacterium]HRV74360.1 response regulator transcription factor [Caldisericia bacterium]